MAIVINGSGTVTGLAVGGLPDATVDSGTLASGIDKTSITDGGNATAITIDASENVGIGVTPETDWHSGAEVLQLGTGASIYGDTTATGNQISSNARATAGSSLNGYKYISTDHASTYQQYGGAHNFRVAPSGSADAAITWTTAMTIDNTGNVLVGQTTGGYRLNVTSNGGTTANFRRDTNTGGLIDFNYGATGVGGISTNGSSTSYNTSSDYRLKENVDYTWDATTRLKQLKPARFNFISDDTTTVDGFLAHEAATVVPECVSGTKDAMRDETDEEGNVTSVPDMQGIDQSKLVPLLVKTIQELEARITALEA